MNLSKCEKEIISQYSYITNDEEYLKLRDLPRHGTTTTYEHSIRVASMAKSLAEKFHLDVDSTVRVGLLHDFCLVNYYEQNNHKGFYLFYHPKEAYENAKNFKLSLLEENAIKSHMFPLAVVPTSKIAWIITFADKIVAFKEKTYINSIPKRNTSTVLFRIISFVKN